MDTLYTRMLRRCVTEYEFVADIYTNRCVVKIYFYLNFEKNWIYLRSIFQHFGEIEQILVICLEWKGIYCRMFE